MKENEPRSDAVLFHVAHKDGEIRLSQQERGFILMNTRKKEVSGECVRNRENASLPI